MENVRVVLASASPRRKEILEGYFSGLEIVCRNVDESLPNTVAPVEGVEILAVRKGSAVADELGADALIISSDTLVELDGVPLGKPKDADDARRMLRALSARGHNVHTGVAVHFCGRVYSGVATTRVFFRHLTDEEIETYVRSGEPMDKAGAYGIQGAAGAFVEKYEGDFDTVVGLSMRLVKELIRKAEEMKYDKE